MISFCNVTGENTKENNPYQPQFLDHSCRILRTGGSESGKNPFLDLISHQLDCNKICLYAKDSFEEKYQLIINKCESVSLRHGNDPKAFIEYANSMWDI